MYQHITVKEVVFYEEGEPIIDGEAGDLKFRIHTTVHDLFGREGNNLYTTVTINLVQALGFERAIKHLDEHLVDIIAQRFSLLPNCAMYVNIAHCLVGFPLSYHG